MRTLFFLVLLLLIGGSTILAQGDAKTIASQFMTHFSSKNLDSAKRYCSGFARNNYFNNKKQIKYFMYEYFKNPTDFVIAEEKKNEVRIGFKSGEKKEYREVFMKENNGKWKIVTKAELLHIKEYYLEILAKDSTEKDYFIGWNTMESEMVNRPKLMHLLRDDEGLNLFAMDFPIEQIREIIEQHNTEYPTVDVALVKGNTFPLFLVAKETGKAKITLIKRAVEDTYATNFIIQGEYTLNSGITGTFRMKVNADR